MKNDEILAEFDEKFSNLLPQDKLKSFLLQKLEEAKEEGKEEQRNTPLTNEEYEHLVNTLLKDEIQEQVTRERNRLSEAVEEMKKPVRTWDNWNDEDRGLDIEQNEAYNEALTRVLALLDEGKSQWDIPKLRKLAGEIKEMTEKEKNEAK